MKNVKKITHSELVTLLRDMENAGGLKGTIISYRATTDAKKNEMNKTSRVTGAPFPYSTLTKTTTSGARFGVSYKKAIENKVERETGAEIEYTPEPVRGFTFAPGSKIFLVRNGEPEKIALRLTFSKNARPLSFYLADGNPIDKNALADYAKTSKPRPVVLETGEQVEKTVVRGVYVSNIEELKINGVRYIIKK